MSSAAIDWDRLRRLRGVFLDGAVGATDYWSDAGILDDYDRTFGARIRWKWDFVLDELARLGWRAPDGAVLDWGCGTGVASRAVLAADPVAPADAQVRVWDRSPTAMRFAATRIATEHPDRAVVHSAGRENAIGTLLVSHVATEVTRAAFTELAELARRATAVLWVEPGTPRASHALIRAREALRETHPPVAPCPRAERCPLADAAAAGDWCHQFAAPPPEAFTSAHWARFARELAIDLRSLPVSFLALDRRPRPALPPGATRLVGRSRGRKGHALLTGCDGARIRELRVLARSTPRMFRDVDRNRLASLSRWVIDGDRLSSVEPIEPP